MLQSQKAPFNPLGEDEWLCGPLLKYRRGAAETAIGERWGPGQFDPSLDSPSQAGVSIDVAGFEAVRLAGNRGFLAVSRQRRYSYGHFKFVQGRVGLRIDYDQPNEPKDYEVQFSPDLQSIIEFEGYGDTWGESIDHKSIVRRTPYPHLEKWRFHSECLAPVSATPYERIETQGIALVSMIVTPAKTFPVNCVPRQRSGR